MLACKGNAIITTIPTHVDQGFLPYLPKHIVNLLSNHLPRL
jgi:hypothetical protein